MLLNLEKSPQWLEPNLDSSPRQALSGIAKVKRDLSDREPEAYSVTRTKLQVQQADREKKVAGHRADFERQMANYNPLNDAKIVGNPASTLFLARLGYNASNDQITEEFGKYGNIQCVRAVKGYAFVVYDSPSSVITAIEETAGSTLWQGHRVLLDFERARTQPFWKPRRLGGGLGGRYSLTRQRQETARFHQIQRRGAVSISPIRHNKQYPRISRNSGDNLRRKPYDRPNDRSRDSLHRAGAPGSRGGRVLRQY